MVVKNGNGLLEESDQTTLQTNDNVYKWEQEILPVGLTDEDSALTNHLDPYKTPKSQKIKSSGEVKRWASVVKASKNYQPSQTMESDGQINNQIKTSELIDSVFIVLPKQFEAQKGFIISRNTLYICVPCNFELDSVIAISNHLKTRKHEDSIISYLKGKIPPQLDIIMEYVSFFGFNLCCNLCRCTIAMSSYNPYETIVNIVAHNACKMHIAQKAASNMYNHDLTHIADLVTNTYTSKSSTRIDNNITGSTRPDRFELKSSNKSESDKKSLKIALALDKPIAEVFPENKSTPKDKQSRLKDLLSSIPSGLMHIDCIVENDKGSITCLICNRVVPPSLHNLYTHLRGSHHKKNKDKSNLRGVQENMKQDETDSTENKHTSNNIYESDIVKKIPLRLKSLKPHNVHIMTSKKFNSHFEKMTINNQLISENDSFLVRNVDGKHSYCKLCRTLLPLSTDLSVLKNNLIEHFQNVKHMAKVSKTKLLSSKQKALNVGSGRVSRSLFAFSENDVETENYLEETEMYDNNTKENHDQSNKVNCSAQVSAAMLNKNEKGDLALAKTSTQKTLKGKKVRCLTVDTEQDEQVLNRRQKQISYGYNTVGYSRFCQLVPKGQRKPQDPVTPPRYAKCSRRSWDGMVRAWRRQLHHWDPPKTPTPDAFPWLTILTSN